MKKLLLCACAIAPAFLFGQTTILSENFDAYIAGNTVVSEAPTVWDTWSGGPGSAEDAFVTDSLSSSASNSINITNGGPSAYETDLILAMPALYTTGTYEFKCKIYIPQGNGGYFNLGGPWVSGGAGFEYGVDVFFNVDGSGSVDAPATGVFAYNSSAWNDVSIMIDLDAGTKSVSINGTNVFSAAWGAASGFGVADIFGVAYLDTSSHAAANQGTANFFIDDVEVIDVTAGLNENSSEIAMNVVPNPSNGDFAINLNEAAAGDYQMTITDIAGNLIQTEAVSVNGTTTLNVELEVTSGVYFVNLSNGNKSTTKRVMIK